MSTSLVKQSLSLFDDDLSETHVKKKKKSKDPMALISTKKKGVKKQLRKLNTQKSTAKANKLDKKSSHDQVRSYDVDYTESSVEALRRISHIKSANKNISKTVFEHHQSRGRRPLPEKKAEAESTAFTDEDFAEFEKQFDFSQLK